MYFSFKSKDLSCLKFPKQKNTMITITHPSFVTTRPCAWANISAALPLPSAMTTGTAGLLVTDSNTVRIVLGPPSRTSSTTGIPCDLPEKKKRKEKKVFGLFMSERH